MPLFALFLCLSLFLACVAVFTGFHAVVVRISTRIVSGFKLPFGEAWRVSIVVFISALVVGALLRLVLIQAFGRSPSFAISTVVGMLVCTVVYGRMIEHPHTGVIGYGRGFLVSVVSQLISAIFSICLFAIAAAITGVPMSDRLESLRKTYEQARGSGSKKPSVAKPLDTITTVEEAQKEAIRLYPDLGVTGSKFNIEYVGRYKRYQRERPGYFRDRLWPICLAEETAESLKTNDSRGH